MTACQPHLRLKLFKVRPIRPVRPRGEHVERVAPELQLVEKANDAEHKEKKHDLVYVSGLLCGKECKEYQNSGGHC